MNILVLDGSPRRGGTVDMLIKCVANAAIHNGHDVECINVCSLKMHFCMACMRCRPDGECCLPEDDAHLIGRKIRAADGLIVGTPTHWGNMSAPLKLLFDRNVPAFMGERPSGLPSPRQKGKPAVIVAACTTPWPFNILFSQSSGAVGAVRTVLEWGGYRILGTAVKSGTRKNHAVSPRLCEKARRLGKRM